MGQEIPPNLVEPTKPEPPVGPIMINAVIFAMIAGLGGFFLYTIITIEHKKNQQVKPAENPAIEWEQYAPSREELDTYTYKLYIDADQKGIVLKGTTCNGTGPKYTCRAVLPKIAPGRHQLGLSVVDPQSGESRQTRLLYGIETPAAPQVR